MQSSGNKGQKRVSQCKPRILIAWSVMKDKAYQMRALDDSTFEYLRDRLALLLFNPDKLSQ